MRGWGTGSWDSYGPRATNRFGVLNETLAQGLSEPWAGRLSGLKGVNGVCVVRIIIIILSSESATESLLNSPEVVATQKERCAYYRMFVSRKWSISQIHYPDGSRCWEHKVIIVSLITPHHCESLSQFHEDRIQCVLVKFIKVSPLRRLFGMFVSIVSCISGAYVYRIWCTRNSLSNPTHISPHSKLHCRSYSSYT